MNTDYPPTTLLSHLGIVDGVLQYVRRLPSGRMKDGDAVSIVTVNGKPHYRIGGKNYNPKRLILAVQTQDATHLTSTRTPRPLTARDMEIYEQLKNGGVYADIGATYGLSRQRIKQIVEKLASRGYVVSARQERKAAREAAYQEAKQSKYGDNYDAISTNPALFRTLKQRITSKRNHALSKGVEFDLTVSDLYPLPEVCPVLGIPIHYGVGNLCPADNALSIDRIDPAKGYVKGNVVLVSMRANRIKNDATVEELQKIAAFYSALV